LTEFEHLKFKKIAFGSIYTREHTKELYKRTIQKNYIDEVRVNNELTD